MKKKMISFLLCLVMILSLSVIAYAAANSYTMTYDPGADGVTNMPAADSGTGGQPYIVSSTIPQREGYEFLGWQLTWEEEEPPAQMASYMVRYVDLETGEDIAAPITVYDVIAGEEITEYSRTIPNYTPIQNYIIWEVQDGGVLIFMYYYSRHHYVD